MEDTAGKDSVDTMTESLDQELIEGREACVKEARSLKLLSNVFMSVALDDKAVCQYVLRILLGMYCM